MILYRLEEGTKVSESEKILLERAKALPAVYDEDSPELTDEMEKAFIAARKNKPYRKSEENTAASA